MRGPKAGDTVMLCPHAVPRTKVVMGHLARPVMINGPDGHMVECEWVAVCDDCEKLGSRGITHAITWPEDTPLLVDPLDTLLNPEIDQQRN